MNPKTFDENGLDFGGEMFDEAHDEDGDLRMREEEKVGGERKKKATPASASKQKSNPTLSYLLGEDDSMNNDNTIATRGRGTGSSTTSNAVALRGRGGLVTPPSRGRGRSMGQEELMNMGNTGSNSGSFSFIKPSKQAGTPKNPFEI